MGQSGCGKSTLLHLLGGLLSPTSGKIIIDGEDISKVSDAQRTDIRRRKIGFVFQRFNLFPTLSAEGNLKLAEKIHSGNGGNSDRRREVLRL
jgi:putative ABC transport system ATP-binding protein